MTFRWLVSFWVVVLSACSTLEREPEVKPWLPLLSPDSLRQSVAAVQTVTGRRDGKEYVLIFQIEIEPRRMVMVGSTPGGNSLFSLEYRDGGLNMTVSPMVPAQLDPAWVLADFQMTFWPLPALEEALAVSPCRIRQQASRRELLCGGERVVRIEYSGPSPWQGPVNFYNERWGYEYTIDTLEWDRLNTVSQTAVGER